MSSVRTRFAPSPTGFIHIGSLRTNMFAWLLARGSEGKFILRIDDTDQQRRVPDAIKGIVEDLQWLGMDIDEGPSSEELDAVGESTSEINLLSGPYGPYIQSLRLDRYREVAEQLVASGHCYRCDCTPEMVQQERQQQLETHQVLGYSGRCRDRDVSADTPHVIRLRLPDQWQIKMQDGVMGEISWDEPSLRDTVLLKSNGFPAYYLACAVDDHDMQISHVLRGTEWISTAPILLYLYQALGWSVPIFAHLPAVLGKDGKKLGKRHGATALRTFREDGYLPEALFNYLAFIGWSPGDGEEQEIFSREELVERFSLERVNRAGGVFDNDKLLWMNGVYIRKLPLDEFIARSIPFIEKAGLKVNIDRYRVVAAHVQERTKVLNDVPAMVDFLFLETIERQIDGMFKKGIDKEMALRILTKGVERFEAIDEFAVQPIETQMRAVAEELDIKPGPAFGVIRVAVTGKTVTPPLFESIVALGRVTTISRIKETLDQVSAL